MVLHVLVRCVAVSICLAEEMFGFSQMSSRIKGTLVPFTLYFWELLSSITSFSLLSFCFVLLH